uniref:Pancreatic trypsin inhibitor n=1 Tax=Rhipicephalus appendiculatus TaxID=34631 RepID=A0A131Z4S1_RHIAP
MYYYNASSKSCELFLSDSCSRRRNAFDKMHECQVTCTGLPCVTVLSPEPDYCDQTMNFFYYNTYLGKCHQNIRCNRLGSNFNSMTDCQQACQLRTTEEGARS